MSNIIKRFGKRWGGSTRLFICCRIGAPRCLFSLSDFAKQKTKVTQEFFENDEGVQGEKKKLFCKKVFFPPCNQSAIFYNTSNSCGAVERL